MTAKVPTMDIGSDRLGMTVAERLRMKRKMTMTTRARVSIMVKRISSTEALIGRLPSRRIVSLAEAGRLSSRPGRTAFTASATSRVFMPGCLKTARKIDWALVVEVKNQAAD